MTEQSERHLSGASLSHPISVMPRLSSGFQSALRIGKRRPKSPLVFYMYSFISLRHLSVSFCSDHAAFAGLVDGRQIASIPVVFC